MRYWKKRLAAITLTTLLVGALLPHGLSMAQGAAGGSATPPAETTELPQAAPRIVFDLSKNLTYVNDQPINLEVPAMVSKGRLYVPVRFLSEQLGFSVKFEPSTSDIYITTRKAAMLLNAKTNTAIINEAPVTFSTVGIIFKDKLLLSARTMSDYMDLDIKYHAASKTVTIQPKVPEPPKPGNASPVAQFSTDKKVYRIGEPIRYMDLSYDPDANGYFLQWMGREDAFFQAGSYTITLVVKDTFGAMSEPYSQTITVTNEVLATAEEYGFYFGAMGRDPRAIPISMDRFRAMGVLQPVQAEWNTSRKLIVSNSPETFREYGILYQDRIQGLYRLFATHLNGMKKMAQFQVRLTNPLEVPIFGENHA